MKKTVLLSLAMLLVTGTLLSAATLRVPEQYVTIQMAINDASDGDTVIVSPGTYLENINFNGKNIVLISTDPNDPEIVATTIIKAKPSSTRRIGRITGREGTVVTFENGETSEAVLTGFTITGGYGTTAPSIPDTNYIYWGAGIFCFGYSPTITRNVIIENIGPSEMEGNDEQQWKLGYGGGICCVESDAIIIRNIIKDNFAYAGGGILIYAGDAKVANNLIYDNTATASGGVVMIVGHLINNTIVGNDAYIGGNAYLVSDPNIGYNSVKI